MQQRAWRLPPAMTAMSALVQHLKNAQRRAGTRLNHHFCAKLAAMCDFWHCASHLAACEWH